MHRAIHPARKSRRPRRRHRRRGDRRGPARHVDRTRIRLRRPENVKSGDAVTYRLNDRDFNTDHVGIVTKVDKKTGKITVISGNSGDKIRKVTIDPKKAQVTGYASPVEKKNSKPKKSADPDNKKSDKPAKTHPALGKTTIVTPRVTLSAWNKCSGSGRKPVKLSATSFEQRWLNGYKCGPNGLSLAGGYPWGAQIGTTITCGTTEFVGRKSDFTKVDNDFRESNSQVRITVDGSALKRKGSRATGEWYCARVEVGGRVTKSNRNDNFGHVFYLCLRLPAERNPDRAAGAASGGTPGAAPA